MNKELKKIYLGDDLPFSAIHPGEFLKEELLERKITQKKLSELTGIKTSILSQTIKGKHAISNNMAAKFEEALGIPSQFWMKMQSNYNLETAHLSKKKEEKYIEVTLYFPPKDRNLIKDLSRKFGWVCLF